MNRRPATDIARPSAACSKAPTRRFGSPCMSGITESARFAVSLGPNTMGIPISPAAYLVERRHPRWVDSPGNAICLCAKHFAQWRHAAVDTDVGVADQIRNLHLTAEGGDGDLSIHFRMCGEDCFIKYVERHLLALRTLVEVADQAGDERL